MGRPPPPIRKRRLAYWRSVSRSSDTTRAKLALPFPPRSLMCASTYSQCSGRCLSSALDCGKFRRQFLVWRCWSTPRLALKVLVHDIPERVHHDHVGLLQLLLDRNVDAVLRDVSRSPAFCSSKRVLSSGRSA